MVREDWQAMDGDSGMRDDYIPFPFRTVAEAFNAKPQITARVYNTVMRHYYEVDWKYGGRSTPLTDQKRRDDSFVLFYQQLTRTPGKLIVDIRMLGPRGLNELLRVFVNHG